MSPWTVYWITRLDAIAGIALSVFIILGLIATAVATIGTVETDGRIWTDKKWRGIIKWMALTIVVSGLLFTFTPSTKEAVAIYALPKIINNEKVQQIPENAVDFINGQMKAWLEDLRGKKPQEAANVQP